MVGGDAAWWMFGNVVVRGACDNGGSFMMT